MPGMSWEREDRRGNRSGWKEDCITELERNIVQLCVGREKTGGEAEK